MYQMTRYMLALHARRSALMVLCVALLATLSACSNHKHPDPIEMVPSTAVVVKTIDLRALLREAGSPVAVKGDSLTVEADKVVSLMVNPDFREPLAALLAAGEAVDFSRMTAFTTSRGCDVVLLPVLDEDLLEKALEAHGQGLEEGEGLDFTTFHGAVAALDGEDFCWIASDLITVTEARAQALHSHFGQWSGIREFLASGDGVDLAINCGNSMISFLGGPSRWLCVSFKVTQQSVSLVGTVRDTEGRCDSIGNHFGEIDTDFLRYTPAEASVVLAYGKYTGNERGLEMLLGRFAPMYLRQADGTTSLWAMPVSGNPEAVAMQEPESWNVATMVHVPEHELSEGVDEYIRQADGQVTEFTEAGIPQWEYISNYGTYYFGAFDGSLIFSTNRPIDSNSENSFTDDFLGRRGSMVMGIPAGSVLAKAWGLPYGLTFKAWLDAEQWKMRVTFNGTGAPAFRALLDLPQLPDMHARATLRAGL